MGPLYSTYLNARADREKAEEWLSHIGKGGRGTDVMRLSETHAVASFCIAGQYNEGGQNYRNSPTKMNTALIRVMHRDFHSLMGSVMQELRDNEVTALIAAEKEVASALQSIRDVKADVCITREADGGPRRSGES